MKLITNEKQNKKNFKTSHSSNATDFFLCFLADLGQEGVKATENLIF